MKTWTVTWINRAFDAPYTFIVGDQEIRTERVSQRNDPLPDVVVSGTPFQHLGEPILIDSSGTLVIELSDDINPKIDPTDPTNDLHVIADAVRIDVPPGSQVHHQVVRKDFEARDIELDPVVHLYFVEVDEPDMHDQAGDLQRLERALEREWRITGLRCDLRVLQDLQPALREGRWAVTVAIRHDGQIVAVWPGFRDRAYGAAVDVGSTTIAVHLCDLTRGEVVGSSGAMNPQIRYGEDLMSRVSYAMLNPDGAEKMTAVVREAVSELVNRTAGQAGIEVEDVLELTLVGNPVMHHLLLGLDPAPIGTAPFALATDHSVDVTASELELDLHPAARAYLPPCIAGYVGADTSAVLLAETPWEHEEVSLIIDVGTNAEIVLGNRERLLAASSPTGPAFEGAQISCGQRAAAGAIERVRIDPESLEEIVDCVRRLWTDDQLCVELSERGKTRAESWGPRQFNERLREIVEASMSVAERR